MGTTDWTGNSGIGSPIDTSTFEYSNGNNQLTQITSWHTPETIKYQYTGDGSLRVREKETSITSTYKEVKWDVFRYGYNGLLKTLVQVHGAVHQSIALVIQTHLHSGSGNTATVPVVNGNVKK